MKKLHRSVASAVADRIASGCSSLGAKPLNDWPANPRLVPLRQRDETRRLQACVCVAGALAMLALNSGSLAAGPLLNGNFSQVNPINPVVMSGPGPEGGPSAAKYWTQFKVVPGSYLSTEVVPSGLSNALQVVTNAGPWGPAQMGNGFGQAFQFTEHCAKASFDIRVVKGQVTGGLAKAAFVDPNTFYPTASVSWITFTQIVSDATKIQGLYFETLGDTGDVPGAVYFVRNVQVGSCLSLLPLKELSQYLLVDPFYYQKHPGDPVARVRITNTSGANLAGPFHVLLQGIESGRSLANADGSYFGTPFVTLSARWLAPGESKTVELQFNQDPASTIPRYEAKIVSGNI